MYLVLREAAHAAAAKTVIIVFLTYKKITAPMKRTVIGYIFRCFRSIRIVFLVLGRSGHSSGHPEVTAFCILRK